jgi:hypothetical protein
VPGFWEFKERTYLCGESAGWSTCIAQQGADVGDAVPIEALVETARYAADVLFVYYLMD